MNANCIFCKIAGGETATELLYQDEEIVAFRDIQPVAPTHLLIVPRKHIPSLADLADDEISLMGRMAGAANKLARELGIAESGYRLVINCGEDGGQIVPHLHLHLLGGDKLRPDP